ncbi:MAG: helix-hairpin-helix domain-containing protein [bacterium]|nr:helix-hairpin-helix domain-containing protein [bacterium]
MVFRLLLLLSILFSLGIPLGFAQYGSEEPTESSIPAITSTPQPTSILDLNSATNEELKQLGLTDDEIQSIRNRILYEGPYENFFDLFDTHGLSRNAVEKLRGKVLVRSPFLDDPFLQRREANAYRMEQLVSDDGFSEGLADQLADQILEPINVNTATIEELTDIQNVSPVDAVAIRKRVESGNLIQSQRELRQTPGLSYWGYTNARSFLTYETVEAPQKIRGFFQIRSFDTPYLPDNMSAIREDVVPQNRTDTQVKLRLGFGHWKFGISTHKGRYERYLYEHPIASISLPQGKIYFQREYLQFGPITLKRLIVGNYQAGFGQGVVFSSGDYFAPRNTGFGYNKNITGIHGDLSSNEQFTYRGLAFEARTKLFESTMLYSSDWKDAVLNPDGSINRFIVLSPRIHYDSRPPMDSTWINPSNGALEDTLLDKYPGIQTYLDNTRETIFAGNLAILPITGIRLGTSWVEALYDRPIAPILDSNTLVLGKEVDEINDDRANQEILLGYANRSTSKLWKKAKSKIRVYGFDWQAVYNNFSFQGEYGELENDGSYFRWGDDPKGIVTSLYAQYSSLNVLLLYRDRDVGYDNPFDRGFSNYARYKGSILEDEYYLRDVTLGQLYDNSFQPQPERGWMFSGRYQFLRQLVTSWELDQWTRRSDQAEYYRWVVRLQYRPIFPLRFNIRLSDQSRDYLNHESPMYYRALQSRIQSSVRLSNFDEIRLMYNYAVTRFAPRPRLIYETSPNGRSPVSGQSASPSEAFGVDFTHHVNRSFWFGGGATIYDGFFWNYEEGDFYVRDGNGLRLYFATGSRIGQGLSIKTKITSERQFPLTNVQARRNNNPPSRANEDPRTLPYAKPFGGDHVTNRELSFRLQLDYHFTW